MKLINVNDLWNKNKPYYNLGVRRGGLANLVKYDVVDIIELSEKRFISLESLLKHIEWEKKFIRDHLIDLEVWNRFGSNSQKDSLRSKGITRLIYLADKGLIDFIQLDYPLVSIRDKKYENILRFFKKESIDRFLNEYVKLEDARLMLSRASLSSTINYLREHKVPVIQLFQKHNMTFIKKTEIKQLIKDKAKLKETNRYFVNENYFNQQQTMDYLGISISKLKNIIKKNILKVNITKSGNMNLYNKSQIIAFKREQLQWEEAFIQNHLIDVEVWEQFGSDSPKDSLRSGGIFKLISLVDDELIEMVQLDYPLIFIKEKKYENIKRFFKKDSVENFLNKYIKLEEANKLLGHHDLRNTMRYLIEEKVNIVQVLQRYNMTFIKKTDIDRMLLKREGKLTQQEKLEIDLSESDYLNRNQIKKILNLTNKRFKQFITKGLLNIVKKRSNNLSLYRKSEVLKLKEIQQKLLKHLDEKWFTRDEILDEYSIDPDRYDIRKIKIPILVASHKRYLNKRVLYSKQSTLEEYERIQYDQLYYNDVGSIFDNIQYRLEMEDFTFSEALSETAKLWEIYLKSKSNEWNPKTYDDKYQRISTMVSVTKIMNEYLKKEIFLYTASELNLLFFNKKVFIHLQIQIYSFLQEIHLSQKHQNKVTFNFHKIKNPYLRKQRRRIKEIYTPNEYQCFFMYVKNNVNFHKELAIKSIKNALVAKEKRQNIQSTYDCFDSAWLYVILHLTNIWRTPDYHDVPRVSFNETSIEPTVEWMENNEISKEDAQTLLRRLQIKTYKYSKTGKERHFFVSEGLLYAFANALTLCEIRTRLLNDNIGESVINFMSNSKRFSRSKAASNFFRHFKEQIPFQTLKMNRTLYSLVRIVSAKDGELHELELLKHFRGHSNVEITNAYLLLTKEEINFLTLQLFSREDHFGFIAETFTDILYGETKELEVKTVQNNFILNNLGDIYKLEYIADFLLHAIDEEEVLKEIIVDMDEREVREKYEKLLTFKLPSKQKNVQCLVGESNCPFPGRDCLSGCHYSIPHFYAISEIVRLLWNDIEYIVNDFSKLKYEGDKERFLIGYVSRLKIFKNALNKYGSVVFDFFKIEQEKWELLLGNLPNGWQQFLGSNLIKFGAE